MRLLPRLAVAVVAGAVALAVATPVQAARPAQAVAAATAAVSAGHHPNDDGLCRQDRRFLVRAHQGNLGEIVGGRLALARSDDTEVRTIAQMLIADHRRLDTDVRRVAQQYDVALPLTPSARQIRALAAVARKSDARFDRAWLRLPEVSHVRTLALIRAELHRGCSADVRALARTAAPVVRHHLAMVREALHHD
jgi:putative membrane protein